MNCFFFYFPRIKSAIAKIHMPFNEGHIFCLSQSEINVAVIFLGVCVCVGGGYVSGFAVQLSVLSGVASCHYGWNMHLDSRPQALQCEN